MRLVKSLNELPQQTFDYLYIDTETTSHDPNKTSLNPWHSCEVLGIGFLADDMPEGLYLPVAHWANGDSKYNLPKDEVAKWLQHQLDHCKEWRNHNVKYDCHVLTNDMGVVPNCKLVDTVTLAKLVDSDWWKGYGLKTLVKEWLKASYANYEDEIRKYTHTKGGKIFNRDYGEIPIDILSEYCIYDVIANRDLYHYLIERVHPECYTVMETENKLTHCLYEIEQKGIRINLLGALKLAMRIRHRLNCYLQGLQNVTGEKEVAPAKNEWCHDYLCITQGLPVLEYTYDKKKRKFTDNPSFSKLALKKYLTMPGEHHQAVKIILKYREQAKLCEMYLETWNDHSVIRDKQAFLHGSYNQMVRTGRMSCSNPNIQQLNKAAKKFFIPRDGYDIVSIDLSQIEFRVIAHYMNDRRIIEEYQKDPKTDYHQVVADMCGIKRKPAKSVNFGLAFTMGKEKLIGMLSDSLDDADIDTIRPTANRIIRQYFLNLPLLKPTMKKAEQALRVKGHTRNLAGRHRNLNIKFCYRSFNTAVQSSAADIMKLITVALMEHIKEKDISLLAVVHDDWVFEIPTERVEEELPEIQNIINNTFTGLRVPIYSDAKSSTISWGDVS